MKQLKKEKISDNKSIDRSVKVAYGLGGLAENTMHNAVNNMANPVFNVGLGVTPALLGVATFIFRLWDAITDPVMGVISDRFSSQFGRRRPFILLGAVFSAFFFMLIWWVPMALSEQGYFWWFLIVSLLFYTGFTIFGVPYLALGYELSSDYHERTRVMAYRTWFASVGGIGIQWLFWLTQRSIFEDTVQGMRYVGIATGLLLLICALAPGLFIKEKILTPSEINNNRSSIKFRSLFAIFKVKPFLYLFAALIAAVMGMFTVGILGFYINVYYVYGGDLKAASTVIGVSGSFYHLCCLASIPLVTWVSIRIGKKLALISFLGLALIGTTLKWEFYTPDSPYRQLFVMIFMAPGLSALWTLLSSMIADVTDYDELHGGTRREGSFGAIYNWTLKLGFAICFLVAGIVLEASGFDEMLGGSQSDQTIFIMRFLYTVVPACGIGVAMILVAMYPLTEDKTTQIRRILDRRLNSLPAI